jgi:hypothetical protein
VLAVTMSVELAAETAATAVAATAAAEVNFISNECVCRWRNPVSVRLTFILEPWPPYLHE